jgi:hypothetical protein
MVHRHSDGADSTDVSFDARLARAMDELHRKQASFAKRVEAHPQWQVDESDSVLTLTGLDKSQLEFAIFPLATYLPNKQNFAWAWTNDRFPLAVRDKAAVAKDLSSVTGYTVFLQPSLRATPEEVDELASMVLEHVQGVALWKIKDEDIWHVYIIEKEAVPETPCQ